MMADRMPESEFLHRVDELVGLLTNAYHKQQPFGRAPVERMPRFADLFETVAPTGAASSSSDGPGTPSGMPPRWWLPFSRR